MRMRETGREETLAVGESRGGDSPTVCVCADDIWCYEALFFFSTFGRFNPKSSNTIKSNPGFVEAPPPESRGGLLLIGAWQE